MAQALATSSEAWPAGWCPVEHAVALLDGRWTVLVLRELFRHGPRRFRQLQQALDELSPRTLTDRLARLQAERLIQKVAVPGSPHPAYDLTGRGRSLISVFSALIEWSEEDVRREERAALMSSRQAAVPALTR